MQNLVNNVQLLGNLGRAIELRTTSRGIVGNVSLATNEKWVDKETGERREHTEWHNLVFWGRAAETVAQYTGKGSKMLVSGVLRTEKYEKDGVTRYFTKVEVDNFQFLSPAPGKVTTNGPELGDELIVDIK
jgi:single-strand DNA-binding protein